MKIGVSITAFNEPLIVPIIKQYEDIADRVVVTVSKKPWYGDYEKDNTAYRAVRDTRSYVIHKEWDSEHDQRNEAMDVMRDMDYIITSHCDTWFTPDDLVAFKNMELEDLHYTCKVLTYWKDYDTVLYPNIGLPTLFVRSDAVFTKMINIQNQLAEPKELPITCYHTSWVKTDEEVLQKIRTYSHADEIQKDWYERVWRNWNDTMTDFGPTNPKDFHSVKKHSLPAIIRQRLL